MEQQTTSRETIIATAMMPPSNSITLGEIENKLIYITPNQPEKATINNFIDKKGIIFKSIGIPSKYFDRYSSNNSIENKQNEQQNKMKPIINFTISTFQLCYSYLIQSWNLASPNNHKITSNKLIIKHKPSITQQATNYYDRPLNNNITNQIIKFDYHPLYRQIIIAFKNGIVFFDIKRNCWRSNVLHNEKQTNITDFAFCPLGMNIAVMCGSGVFIWNLSERKGELIAGSYDRVRYSPDSKYIAVYKLNSRYVYIYDLYSHKMIYKHQMFYKIIDIQWISSTKSNKYCPLRLLFQTNSCYLYLLNMLSFEIENFICKNKNENSFVTHVQVSNNGNGIMAIMDNKYLYYISLKQFCEPIQLTNLLLDFNNNNLGNDYEEKGNDKKEEETYEYKYKKYIVKEFKWSQCDRRIAIIYKELNGNNISKFVSIYAYDLSTYIGKLGFITNPHKNTFPLHLSFRNHFNLGALLAICWSNAIISQHHLCFHKNNQLNF